METRYFVKFSTFFNQPIVYLAEATTKRNGATKIWTNGYEEADSIDALLSQLFVEVPFLVYETISSHNYWNLGHYREYINNPEYTEAVVSWAGFDGVPEVDESPLVISEESLSVYKSGIRHAVSLSRGAFNESCFIFPQFDNVIGHKTSQFKFIPYWNGALVKEGDAPREIEFSEIPNYKEKMAHIGMETRTGYIIKYFDNDIDD